MTTLKEFNADEDPNKWWRLSAGEMENLFDEANEEIDRLTKALKDIITHQEIVASKSMAKYSGTVAIAKRALNYEANK